MIFILVRRGVFMGVKTRPQWFSGQQFYIFFNGNYQARTPSHWKKENHVSSWLNDHSIHLLLLKAASFINALIIKYIKKKWWHHFMKKKNRHSDIVSILKWLFFGTWGEEIRESLSPRPLPPVVLSKKLWTPVSFKMCNGFVITSNEPLFHCAGFTTKQAGHGLCRRVSMIDFPRACGSNGLAAAQNHF